MELGRPCPCESSLRDNPNPHPKLASPSLRNYSHERATCPNKPPSSHNFCLPPFFHHGLTVTNCCPTHAFGGRAIIELELENFVATFSSLWLHRVRLGAPSVVRPSWQGKRQRGRWRIRQHAASKVSYTGSMVARFGRGGCKRGSMSARTGLSGGGFWS